MPLLNFTQTDTASPCGEVVGCSGAILATTTVGRECVNGGTPGVADEFFKLGGGDTNRAAVMFEMTPPNESDWKAGNYIVRLNITTANSNLTWVASHVCRFNSACVNQETIGSLTGQSIGLGTTGVKTMTVSGAAVTPSDNDKVYIVLVFDSSATMGTDTADFIPNQDIDTPIDDLRIEVDVSDAVATTEALTVSIDGFTQIVLFPDTIVTTEKAARNADLSRSGTDTVGTADTVLAEIGVISRDVSDAVVVSDSVIAVAIFAKSVDDAIFIADIAAAELMAIERDVSDTLETTDQASWEFDVSPADAVAVADKTSLTFEIKLADPLVTADVTTFTRDLERVAADILATIDVAVSTLDLERAIEDVVAATDQTFIALDLSRTFSDTLAVTDTAEGGRDFAFAPSDAIALLDSISLISLEALRSLEDVTAVTDKTLVVRLQPPTPKAGGRVLSVIKTGGKVLEQ